MTTRKNVGKSPTFLFYGFFETSIARDGRISYTVDILTLICLSLSLAADAFVTAVCDGMAYRPKTGKRVAIALSFGAAQGVMPVLGALLGETLDKLLNAQNYLAFAALLIVGVLMFIDGFNKPEKAKSLGAGTIALQAFATSVDAFACGLTLVSLPFPLWADGITIGCVTAALCMFGVCFASAIGKRFAHPERFKIVGGGILVALAMKHLIFCFI